MDISRFIESAALLVVLLNPFLLAVYLLTVIRELSRQTFAWIMIRAATIAGVVFIAFAWLGDMFFADVLHVRYAAFLLFGGIVFIIIGIRFVFEGPQAIW